MSTATVHFYNSITQETAGVFRNLCLNALLNSQPQPESLMIMFSSPGGDINPGLTMYEFLRTFPIPVTMCNVGAVESIACVVFLGADNRIALPHTHFKLHGFHWTFGQPTVPYHVIAEVYMSLNNATEQYANIFEERTQGAEQPIDDVRKYLKGSALVLNTDDAIIAGVTTSSAKDIKLVFPGAHLFP